MERCPSSPGDWDVSCSTTPVAVLGGLTFASVSAGWGQTCGLTTSGAAYCWGPGWGDISNGSDTPEAVAGGLTFASLSDGGNDTCGVTTAGAAYCWGLGYSGENGDSAPGVSITPTPVAGGLTFAAVSAGRSHSCGVTTTGALYCWGENTFGELGVGTSTGPERCPSPSNAACSTIPIAVAGRPTFATVSAGGYSTCGVITSGAPYCWGYIGRGLLGDGTEAGAVP